MSKNSPLPGRTDKNAATLSTEERRQVAPDLVLESGMFWEKYKLPVMAGITALVLGLVGSELYQGAQTRAASAASEQLNAARTDADYQKVIDTYPGSQAAANAYLLLGRSKYNAKDYAGAVQMWRTLVQKYPQHPLAPTALTGVAGALGAQGKDDEARGVYQQIATAYPKSYAAPLARLGEADVLLAQRKTQDARRVFEDLIASSQNGIAGRIAEQGLKNINTLPPIGAASAPSATPVPASTPAAPPAPVPAASAAPVPTAEPSAAAAPSPAAPAASVSPSPQP